MLAHPSSKGVATLSNHSSPSLFPFHVYHTVLLWFCAMAMLRFLYRAPVFLAVPPPPPLLLFALNLPCRLVAEADALSGMDNSD
jgi:hypothetical protein